MLWGAFTNASSAMQVFTNDLGSISQNISNVNTTGYKRQELMFATNLSEHKGAPATATSGLNIFGVKASQRNLIDAQGSILPSGTWSDLAINGKGFFMVARPTSGAAATTAANAGAGANNVPTNIDTNSPSSVLYTRAGAWSRTYGPDTDPTLARSYFVGNDGSYLLGWMADDTGALSANPKLEPVYTLGPRPIPNNGTSSVDASSTLKPSSVTMPGRATTKASIIANLPRDAAMGGTTTSQKITDPSSASQSMTINWTRTGATTYTATATMANATMDTSTWNVEVDSTGKVISPVTSPTVNFTWSSPAGSTSQAVDLTPPKRGDTMNIPVQVFDQNYTEHSATLRFERTGVNSWYMYPDGGTGATSASTPVAVTFDDNGKMTSPASGLLSQSFSWTTGTPPVTGTASVNFDMSKITQYADTGLYQGTISQDGYGKGTLMATTFNPQGELMGYYDNGRSRMLFKVPVANFTAENSLEAVSGTMFRRTTEAGAMVVSAVEDAPGASSFSGSSLEGSTVAIEDEFTRMIMTQKAYSMNSQVFKTADDMTSVARDLKG